MNYAESIQFLYGLQVFGAKFGLENTRRLASLAGDPQDRLRFIHVAGTNGKGSTCAFLESVYRHAGLRVGLFTSPHLVAFNERIQVDRVPIVDSAVVRLLEEMRGLLGSFPASAHPTFFEVVTIMALRHFAAERCDLVVWETGLGGRLDATNIVRPLASVITNIQLDHQRWLGDTLARIASEKAGIIKPGLPVVTAERDPEPLGVIREVARGLNAPLFEVSAGELDLPPLRGLDLRLPGDHQRLNAALAATVVRALGNVFPVSSETLRLGLARATWPGRFQIVRREGGGTVVLDGAHNPAGVESLRQGLLKYFPGVQPDVVFGVMADKDWPEMSRLLAPLAASVRLAPVRSARTAPPVEVVETWRQANPAAEVRACDSVGQALEELRSARLLVVTGSLHFIGEAMEALGLAPGLPVDEKGLNEWTAPR